MKTFNTGETEKELKEKYNPEGSTLRKAQLRMLEMAVFLDKVLKENGITYYIEAGNLLGAVRHGGFIPWDDDFDIAVDAKDIKKIKKIFSEQIGDFVLQTHSNDPGFVKYWPVLRDTKSLYVIDNVAHNAQKYRGLQIDIFPFDFGRFTKVKRLIQLFVIFNERYLVGRHKILSSIFYYFPKIFIMPLFKGLSKIIDRKYYAYSLDSAFQTYFKYEDIFPPSEIKFEGYTFSTFHNIEEYLKIEYGENYMNLPSAGSRDHHKINEIQFL